MKKGKAIYTLKHLLSSLVMLLALAWLTVCLPYVNESRQQVNNQVEQNSNDTGNDDNNPLGNTTEEKTESGTSLPSEYLHDMLVLEHHFVLLDSFFKCHSSDLYLAYHPDLVIPPPEA